jgi:hypothetical protein
VPRAIASAVFDWRPSTGTCKGCAASFMAALLSRFNAPDKQRSESVRQRLGHLRAAH